MCHFCSESIYNSKQSYFVFGLGDSVMVGKLFAFAYIVCGGFGTLVLCSACYNLLSNF